MKKEDMFNKMNIIFRGRIDTIASCITLIFSVVIFCISFILPPKGIIDPSVLTAVGELGIITLILFKIPSLISGLQNGKLSLQKGDITLEVDKSENK